MSNEEIKKECSCDKCEGDCKCDKEPKSNTMPNGEKVVSFKEEPSIVDVAKMLMTDEGFLKTVDGASIVATRVLKHANGQDAVLQVYFHKKVADKIIVTKEMPKVK